MCLKTFTEYSSNNYQTILGVTKLNNGTFIRDDNGKIFDHTFMNLDYLDNDGLCIFASYNYLFLRKIAHSYFHGSGIRVIRCSQEYYSFGSIVCQRSVRNANEKKLNWRKELEKVELEAIPVDYYLELVHTRYTYENSLYLCNYGRLFDHEKDSIQGILSYLEKKKSEGVEIPTTIWVNSLNSNNCDVLIIEKDNPNFLKNLFYKMSFKDQSFMHPFIPKTI